MQILWAQRASQHRAHFLYNPSEPFRFTWGVSSSRTIDLHLIWFLPGVTFHHFPRHRDLCWSQMKDQIRLKQQWFSFIWSKTLLIHIVLYSSWEDYRHTSCFRPVTFTVLLFITDNSQNSKYRIPHKLHHILPRRLCKPNLKQPWLRDMFYCWLCSCYHLGCLKRGQIESALCLFNKRILVSARSDEEAVR